MPLPSLAPSIHIGSLRLGREVQLFNNPYSFPPKNGPWGKLSFDNFGLLKNVYIAAKLLFKQKPSAKERCSLKTAQSQPWPRFESAG